MIPLYVEPLILLYAFTVSYILKDFHKSFMQWHHTTKFILKYSFLYGLAVLSFYQVTSINSESTAQIVISSLLAYIIGKEAIKQPRNIWYRNFAALMLVAILCNTAVWMAVYTAKQLGGDWYIWFVLFNEYTQFFLHLTGFYLMIRIAYHGDTGAVIRVWVDGILDAVFAVGADKKLQGAKRKKVSGPAEGIA